MEIDIRIKDFCQFCKYRETTLDSRIFNCSLTKKAPDFEGACGTYWDDPVLVKRKKHQLKSEEEAKIGKKKFIYFSIIALTISISSIIFGMFTFYSYQNLAHLKGIGRLIIEMGMLFAIYNGNSVVKNLFSIFCAISIIVAIVSISDLLEVTNWGLILIPLIMVYIYAIIFLNADKHFLSFFNAQKGE